MKRTLIAIAAVAALAAGPVAIALQAPSNAAGPVTPEPPKPLKTITGW